MEVVVTCDSGDVDGIQEMILEKIAELYPDEDARPRVVVVGSAMGVGCRIADMMAHMAHDGVLVARDNEDMLLRRMDMLVPRMPDFMKVRHENFDDYKFDMPSIEFLGKQTGGAIWRDQEHLHEDPAHGRQYVRKHKKHTRNR